jgi:hypothetical protein
LDFIFIVRRSYCDRVWIVYLAAVLGAFDGDELMEILGVNGISSLDGDVAGYSQRVEIKHISLLQSKYSPTLARLTILSR